MPITITAPFPHLNLTLSAPRIDDLARALEVAFGSNSGAVHGVQVAAETLNDLLDAIEGIACRMDDPDRIAAIRVDEDACRAELDLAARPVDTRRLH